ncbi:MAG: WD40 repeat domain-containing protein, partial [Anaerolineales bacterium]|nr:WD40 repeat domain-containing protein [Anaerolineales bacterium]
ICLSPLRAGLVADPLPELLDVLTLLPESEQVALLTRWAHGAPPEQAAAVAIWVARLCAGAAAAQSHLAGLAADPALADPTATIGLVLAALEPYLLAAADSQQPAVSAFLELAAGWDALRSPTLQRILNRLTAQIAARFGAEFRDQPAYRRLSESRRDGELSRALSYRQQGLESDDPAAALNFYRASLNYLGRILLRRRQAVWTFATTAAIRAAAPLAGGQRALLATQAGLLHQLNLLERQQETLLSLPDGSMPRALASGPLESRSHSSVVVLTDTGELLLGHTGAPNGLMLSQQVTVDEDLRCLTIIPHTPDNPPRFLAGGHAGLIQLFAQSANGRWRESQSFRVKAEWISALRVTRLDEKQPPVILAGGSRAGQRGILYRLSLAGVQEQEPLYFPGIVRDIRTIAQLNTSERLVAVICDDGYLYVMKGNGARLWQYRIGHAARSFAIHDIDNNGQPEIIVGGEDNTVLILDVNGSVHWLIPAQAPVTHVAVTEPEPNQPQLLIADMENTLQVVQVNPPNSQQEKLLFVEAERSLDLLARGLGISSLNLVRQWLEQAPTPFLRGYAFHQCANWVLDGYEEMLAPLLAADITAEQPEIQRAYAR